MRKLPLRLGGTLVLSVLAVVSLAACQPAFPAPGKTASITLVSSTTTGGWRYDYYRNGAYPCAVSGYQTFTIATKVGSSPTATRPLWVRMHGGGVGYFDAAGNPRPGIGQMTEESAALQRGQMPGPLMDAIRADAAGFRMMTVSMCSHDFYAGPDVDDPNNPGTIPGGAQRTVNGLYATKAAIQFAQTTFPTDDVFLHGGSAGAFGSYHVAWSLQQQGLAPAGVVADSGVLNLPWQLAMQDDPECGRTEEALAEIPKRIHPVVADPANQPDRIIADGRFTVPVVDVYSIGDPNPCGQQPMSCPLPDGTTVTMGSADCLHAPVRLAIEAQGSTSRSISMRLCVSPDEVPGSCATHTSTSKSGRINTLAPWPAAYWTPIVDWVHARLADD